MIHLNRVQWNNSTDLLVGDSESPEEGRHGLVVDLLPESDAARVNLEETAVAITATATHRYDAANDRRQRAGNTGSLVFRIHLKPESPLDYRSAYMCPLEQQRINELVNHMFASGFMMLNTCTAALSTVMNREHVDRLVDSLVEGFHQLERSG